MKNQPGARGSVLLEALASTGFAALVLSSGLALCFFLFARTWLKRAAYEAAVCLATGRARYECEMDLKMTVEAALPVGALQVRELYVNSKTAGVRMSWKTSSFSIAIEESIKLPLIRVEKVL